jgi:hypothetical protein
MDEYPFEPFELEDKLQIVHRAYSDLVDYLRDKQSDWNLPFWGGQGEEIIQKIISAELCPEFYMFEVFLDASTQLFAATKDYLDFLIRFKAKKSVEYRKKMRVILEKNPISEARLAMLLPAPERRASEVVPKYPLLEDVNVLFVDYENSTELIQRRPFNAFLTYASLMTVWDAYQEGFGADFLADTGDGFMMIWNTQDYLRRPDRQIYILAPHYAGALAWLLCASKLVDVSARVGLSAGEALSLRYHVPPESSEEGMGEPFWVNGDEVDEVIDEEQILSVGSPKYVGPPIWDAAKLSKRDMVYREDEYDGWDDFIYSLVWRKIK